MDVNYTGDPRDDVVDPIVFLFPDNGIKMSEASDWFRKQQHGLKNFLRIQIPRAQFHKMKKPLKLTRLMMPGVERLGL